ncbi:unnamed protein product [Ectocarpus sp. CCAP 1310/34]|nr:unnamed protein product [Ectocarpus sp. CCAP 1310/34]
MAFWPPLLADLVVVSGSCIAGTVIFFVAVRITSFINRAMSEALCGHAAAFLFMSSTQFHAAAPSMSSTGTNHSTLITTMRSRSKHLMSSGVPGAVAGVVIPFLNRLRSCMFHPGRTKKSHPQSRPRQQHKEEQQEAINSLSSDLEDYEVVTCTAKSERVAEKIINHKVSSVGTNKSRVLPTLC